jgi:hypothetical protein
MEIEIFFPFFYLKRKGDEIMSVDGWDFQQSASK